MNRKFILGALFILAIFLSASFASRTYAAVVINEIYPTGGNSSMAGGDATYNQDYVELYNNGTTNVDINGYSLQYNAPTGTGTYSVCTITAADTIIEPGTYFLIGLATPTGGVGGNIPTANTTCSTINLNASGGKIALVSSNNQLTGPSCPPTGATIVDFVGYGTANCAEGAAEPAPPNNQSSLQRTPTGTDTNNNAADFTSGAPTPQASGQTAAPATIEGRVKTTTGRAVSKARITLTDDEGNTRFAMSNPFGYYRFVDVAVGQTYILNISSKSRLFAEPTRVITVNEDLVGIDFIAYEVVFKSSN